MPTFFHSNAFSQEHQKVEFNVSQPDSSNVIDSSLKTIAPLIVDSIASDSTKKKKTLNKRHSPKKAALLSLAFPGLGQAYNKRWWKLPIVYAGFAGLGYGLYHFGSNYSGYRSAYRNNLSDTTQIYSFKGISDVAELRSYRDFNKRNLDIMAVITAAWYALQIIDAAVDAHLFHWNVDDKLAMNVQPMMPQIMGRGTVGLTLNLSFVQPPKRKLFQL